jgi:Domain of unknown function (DUF4926)
MRRPSVNDYVRLVHDVPEMLLCRGDIGIVRSTWFAPAVAYEVEFHPLGANTDTRVLLRAEQVEVEDAAAAMSPTNSDQPLDLTAPPVVG